jgi:hypothetical protein
VYQELFPRITVFQPRYRLLWLINTFFYNFFRKSKNTFITSPFSFTWRTYARALNLWNHQLLATNFASASLRFTFTPPIRLLAFTWIVNRLRGKFSVFDLPSTIWIDFSFQTQHLYNFFQNYFFILNLLNISHIFYVFIISQYCFYGWSS